LAICTLLLCLGIPEPISAVTILKVSDIQAAGNVLFKAVKSVPSDVISWKVTHYLIDETGGGYSYPADTLTANGDSAQFTLQKKSGQYTFYKIFAFDGSEADSITVQVLTAGVVQKYLYTNYDISPYPVPAWVVLPLQYSASSKFLVAMCGINRNASGIASYWIPFANTNNYVIAAPEFNSTNWSSDDYILGNMFTGSDGTGNLNPKNIWTFNIVEQIHRQLYLKCGLTDSTYELWGHSAGGQFVHRLAFFLPDTLISRYIAGNSGWYTCPDLSVIFPWGAQNSKLNLTNTDLVNFTNQKLVIMRGTADTIRDGSLNTDPLSDAQGLNRYTRAGYFYNAGVNVNTNLTWQLVDVLNVGHNDQQMAIAGGNYILAHPIVVNQAPASATWLLTSDGAPATVGNVSAGTIDTLSSINITGFLGHSFSPDGLILGASGPTNWPADGSSTTANSSFTGLSTGTTRYIQFTVSPVVVNSLTITSITIPLTENGSATNINAALAYSTDGTNFTTFNSNGLTGNPLPSNTMQIFSAASNVTVTGSGMITVRIILWRKASSIASSSSVTVGTVVLSGYTPLSAPSITLSSHGTLNFGITAVGNSSSSQSFNVSGSNLTDNILITPSAGFQIRTGTNSFSTSAITLMQSAGSLASTQIDVRFTPLVPGNCSGTISCTTLGGPEQDVALSGTGIALSSATWLLTANGSASTVGSISAGTIDTLTPANIIGFAGHTFGTGGLKLGATGPTNWPADGSSTTANSSFTGLSTGTTRYIQFTISPLQGNILTLTGLTVPLTENGPATNITAALAYSIDGINFTTFNSNGLSGNTLPSNTLQTFSSAPGLVTGNGGTVTVRVILWRKAGSTASSSSVTVGTVVLSGYTTIINPSLSLTALMEGIYNGATMISDTVTVELHNASSPYALVDIQKGLLNSSGVGSFSFSNALNSTPYYIVVKHRNSLETWSASSNSFSSSSLSYNFTSSLAQAYGNNLILKAGKYCIYGGDATQDGTIDLSDLIGVDNDNVNFSTGYISTDINGDGTVDLSDLIIVDNNNSAFVTKITPLAPFVLPHLMRSFHRNSAGR
jgi:hypothetical protein